jgi:hypothetical protein
MTLASASALSAPVGSSLKEARGTSARLPRDEHHEDSSHHITRSDVGKTPRTGGKDREEGTKESLLNLNHIISNPTY